MKYGKSKARCALLLAVIAGSVGIFAEPSPAGLAQLFGGSGYSGNLSKNRAIRHQQLICDPSGAPISGSTSVKYDPCVVSLSGLEFGPGYTGQGFVEEEKRCDNKTRFFLQNINSFLECPKGKQTGYVQVTYSLEGKAGTMTPEQGFTTEASNGVAGVDTHSLMFTYLPDVPDTTVAKYTIYADTGTRPSGNKTDSLSGISPSGAKFTLGPSQLSRRRFPAASPSLCLPPPGPDRQCSLPLRRLRSYAIRARRQPPAAESVCPWIRRNRAFAAVSLFAERLPAAPLRVVPIPPAHVVRRPKLILLISTRRRGGRSTGRPQSQTEDPEMAQHYVSSQATSSDLEAVEQLSSAYKVMTNELGKVIVGQEEVVEQVLTAMFCQGHVLLVGVPGLAKTLLVKTISDVLHLSFKRVQFTPDLMPSDITGTAVLEEDHTTGKRAFRFVKGPLFANMVLADEINRTPPKTQAALLEAMQEHRVTSGENTYELPEPFFVLATQNPIEQEGTYPLPEAQLDRFMFQTNVKYPKPQDEIQIMKQATTQYRADLSRLLDGQAIINLQQIVRRVPVAEHVYAYARDLVRATRAGEPGVPPYINDLVQWGAGPRASIYLIMAGKARAILNGRVHVTTEDIARVALPVLRHRILTTFSAEAAGMNSDKVIERLLRDVPRTATAAA